MPPFYFRQKTWYRLLLWLMLIVSLGILWKIFTAVLIDPNYIPVDDFGQFWAAGQLNFQGQNPYDPENILRLKYEANKIQYTSKVIPMMWSPPWVIPLLMPFGVIYYSTSRFLWLIFNIILVLYCSNQIWQLYRGPERFTWVAWLVAFTFAPTISVLNKGQITTFMLLGVVLFLKLIKTNKSEWLIGASAALIAIKPQLLYLFWLALLFWVIDRGRWKVLFGVFLTLLGGYLIAMAFNPPVIEQYIHAVLNYPPVEWATPTFGAYLRMIFGVNRFWLQFLPLIIGVIWFIIYWNRHHNNWQWIKEMPILVFVSMLFTAYAWTYDDVLLIIAVLPAFIYLLERGWNKDVVLLIVIFFVIGLLDLLLHKPLDEFFFIWLVPALFLWYWFVIQRTTDLRVEQ